MRVALIVCGALGKEVKQLVRERGWEADIYGVPALLHFRPREIVEAVERRLDEIASRYERVIAVYGDCGTAGALDAVLARHGAIRLAGAHCYEMFAGAEEFVSIMEAEPGTFFLTDWLVRSFDRAVVRGLGIDRFPELQQVYFGNYTRIVYLVQSPTDRLLQPAREIAAWFDLPLEVRLTGLGQLERLLQSSPGGADDVRSGAPVFGDHLLALGQRTGRGDAEDLRRLDRSGEPDNLVGDRNRRREVADPGFRGSATDHAEDGGALRLGLCARTERRH